MHTEKEKKLLKYFNRLNEANQDYILAEMIDLYREQNETFNYNYPIIRKKSNIIYVDF